MELKKAIAELHETKVFGFYLPLPATKKRGLKLVWGKLEVSSYICAVVSEKFAF